jgi:thiol-disulfide isomerase/thioredoxin
MFFALQSATRLVVALFGTTCVLACPPMSATAGPSEAPQTTMLPALKTWSGPEKKHPFLLDDLHGNRRDLQTFAGKVVLVHFFATWCEPCVSEMASLRRLATTTRGKPLAILAVDVAEVDLRVRAFFAKQPVDFTVLLDRDRAVSKSWEVTALPTTFVLDASLAPKLFIEGDLDWSRPDVLTAIESLYPAADRPQGTTVSKK